MATLRKSPYSAFNFLVGWDELDENSVQAGFQEVSGLGLEVTLAEYRAGNSKDNAPIKITGTYKVPDVTLKRGLIGSLDELYGWLNAIRDGSQEHQKTVRVRLMSEDRTTVAQEWKLIGARPIKYTGPTLSAKGGGDVAMEEMTLSCERMECA